MTTTETGLTPRAVVIGLAVVAVMCVWSTYVEMHARSSRLTMGHFPLALFALLIFLLILNPVIRRVSGRGLSRDELIVVTCIGLVGAVLPVDGIVGYLLGIISSFYYFATPENRWAEYFHPYLPNWLVPRGSDAIWRQFFEGSGGDPVIPWGMWVVPLFWWSAFILVLLWVSACIMVVMRKQWMENERLVYPIAYVTLEMVGDGGQESSIRSIGRNRLFWIGFATALLLFVIEIMSWIYPTFPIKGFFPWVRLFQLFKDSRSVVINPFHFYTMGFSYLAPTDVQFSVWFFYFLNVAEGALFARFGYAISGSGGDAFSTKPPAIGWQGFGAVIFMVAWGFYIARDHLKGVFRKAVYADDQVDDSEEMMSYRTAVFGGGLGVLFLAGWLFWSGMGVLTVVIYLAGSFILYIGMARLVVEGGVPYTWGPISPQVFVMNILGTNLITGPGITSILLSYSFINYLRGLFIPPMAHVARLGHTISINRRRLLPIVFLAAAVGLAASLYYTLKLAYAHGAYNTYGFPPFFGGNPKAIFSNTLSKVKNPFTTSWDRLMFLGIGAAIMGLLTFLRSRLVWWRLHPIGFVTSSMINTNFLATPFFIAWVVKSIVLGLGGVQLYRRSLPLFIGLMVGYVAGVSLCSVVDMLAFPQQGHVVHTW
jgi:hypothetical protein